MFAKRLAEAIGDSIVTVGISESANDVVDEVEYLLSEPLDLFLNHPNWPSGLTSDGVPFEFSIAISGDDSLSIRYAVDTTDHRQGIGGNWSRYLEYAKGITRIASDQYPRLWKLLTKHLDGTPPLFRSRMVHGVGYGSFGSRRSTLYFTTRWLSNEELEKRFPSLTSAIESILNQYSGHHLSNIDIISYDFIDTGEVASTKFYRWLDYNNLKQLFSEASGHHSDLVPASKVFKYFLASSNVPQIERLFPLQFSFDQHMELFRQKIHFLCSIGGWNRPKGLLDLVAYLSNTFSINMWPLYAVLGVFSEYKIPLKPTFVAIGPGELHPSVSFYFCPVLKEAPCATQIEGTTSSHRIVHGKINARATTSARSRFDLIDKMLKRAIDYILKKRDKDGHWVDFALPQGMSDEWVTAYIVAALSNDSSCYKYLAPSVEWLQKRFRPDEGWGYNRTTPADADSTALGLLALHRNRATLPESANYTLLRYRLPSGGYCAYTDQDLDHEHGTGPADITSAVLLTQIETGLFETNIICDALINLISQQREEGGWNSFWWKDDLFAACRTLNALNAFIQFATLRKATQLPENVIQSAISAVKYARPSISAQAIPDEPFILGLWLSAWFASQGVVYYPSVDRILRHLCSLQQDDGRWLSVPIKRVARTKLLRPWARSDSGKLYLDPQCLITTITVIEGIKALRQALKSA